MTKNEYVVCGLCGMNKVVRSVKRGLKGKSEELQWPSIDIKQSFSLQVREGGGKKAGSGVKGRGKAPGSGFHIIEAESLTLKEIMANPRFANVLEGMKDQLLRLVKDLKEIGFIESRDLE